MERLEPFSARVVELREKKLFKETNFEFAPLKFLEWVTPRVTEGNVGNALGSHIGAAEARMREKNIPRQFQERRSSKFTPSCRPKNGSAIPKTKFIRQKAEEFLKNPASREFLKQNKPSQLLWNAQHGITALKDQLYQLNLKGHFRDFDMDTASNNFLFRGFNKKGHPVISVIDQNPRTTKDY